MRHSLSDFLNFLDAKKPGCKVRNHITQAPVGIAEFVTPEADEICQEGGKYYLTTHDGLYQLETQIISPKGVFDEQGHVKAEALHRDVFPLLVVAHDHISFVIKLENSSTTCFQVRVMQKFLNHSFLYWIKFHHDDEGQFRATFETTAHQSDVITMMWCHDPMHIILPIYDLNFARYESLSRDHFYQTLANLIDCTRKL